MTREEAIEVLKLVDENASCDDCLYYAQMEDCPTDEDCIIRQALDMAIQALQAQDKADTAYDRGYDRGYDDGFFDYEVCHKCKHFEYDELFIDETGEERDTSYCGRQAQAETKCNPNDCPHPYGTYETCNECKANGDNVFKMRDATPEEQEAIDRYIKSISKPTGVDFDSLSDSQIIHHLTDKAYSKLCLLAEKGREALQAQADGDLISRQAVIEAIYDIEMLKYRIDLEKAIKELPTVAIPRCEEREKGECPFYSGYSD